MGQELSSLSPIQDSPSNFGKTIKSSCHYNTSNIIKTANINLDNTIPFSLKQTNKKEPELHFNLQEQKIDEKIGEISKQKVNETVEEMTQSDDITDWNIESINPPNKKCKFIENKIDHAK